MIHSGTLPEKTRLTNGCIIQILQQFVIGNFFSRELFMRDWTLSRIPCRSYRKQGNAAEKQQNAGALPESQPLTQHRNAEQ